MVGISKNSGSSLRSLFNKYHDCVYWGQCEDSFRSQLLSEIKEMMWMNPEYVEEQVKYYLNNLQWRDVQIDKGQLEDLIIRVQAVKINNLISQNKLKCAYELLKELPKNEETISLRKKMLSKIAINGDENLIILAFNEYSDQHPSFKQDVYNRAISCNIPSLAAHLLINNDMIIPSDIKTKLVNVIENGGEWGPALWVLSHKDLSVSAYERKKLFKTMMNNAGNDKNFAREALCRVDKIPRIYAKKLKNILRNIENIENEERYFWLVRNGFCKIGIKKLLQKMEIITKTYDELLPTWNEYTGLFEGLSLDKCTAYTLIKLIPLVCEFWSYSKFPEGSKIDREISSGEGGTSLSIGIICTNSGIYHYRDLLIVRVEPDKFRCCLRWQKSYACGALSRMEGNHFRSFWDALK